MERKLLRKTWEVLQRASPKEMVPASRFFNTTVPSSRAPSCGKDDASEAKTGESAWKKTPLPLSESGVSTAATPFVRPTHTPRSNSSEKNRISNIARGPALPEEADLITSLGWNIASDTPEQHVALEPVPDDNASVRSGSGSHHTGRQSVVGGAPSSRTSKMRLTFNFVPLSPSKQQSVSAQQHVEHRVHAPPTDTPSGRSMWKSKLLPNSETASEDGKSSKTIPGIPVPIEFGPPPQSITGRSHKARSIVTPSNASNVDVAEKGPAHPALSHASTPGPFGLKTESLDPLAHPGSIDTAPPAVGRYTPTSPETRSMSF
ncbi:uncharacterized protein EI90DRAFT_1232228 [Cantharellus anzutake]|uniref:uncharacterized protein n=1 Tax=Cantharellus anzutake TaxID=1750568 RepID=UPI001904DED1|nr:uncharacterized protein EI90DRAFT_1232228 [Cantharellus anzutake]KAF8330189.1 hypothetical protein EI90DRAFT_1232228 [Cantharellus anzutake]